VGHGAVAGSCGHCNEPSGSIKCGDCLDKLGDCRLQQPPRHYGMHRRGFTDAHVLKLGTWLESRFGRFIQEESNRVPTR
jgi:hypothetical protein